MAKVYVILESNFSKGYNFSGNNTMLPLHPLSALPLEVQEKLKLAYITCSLIIGVVSLLGNASVMAIVFLNRQMRTTTNFYIVNMAISDLLYDVIVIVPNVLSQSKELWITGVGREILCKFVPFVRDVSFTVSIWSMVAIALDRFYAVVYPLKRDKPFYLKTKMTIPLIWSIAVSLFCVYWYIYRVVPPGFCIPQWPTADWSVYHYYLLVGLGFVLPLLFMAILYSVIIYKIKHQIIPGNSTSEMVNARRNRNKSITKLGVFIVVWFFISWAPYHTKNLLMISWKGTLPSYVSTFWLAVISDSLGLLSMTSVASNPIVCYACSTNFRECLVGLLRCSCSSRGRRQRQQAAVHERSRTATTEMNDALHHED